MKLIFQLCLIILFTFKGVYASLKYNEKVRISVHKQTHDLLITQGTLRLHSISSRDTKNLVALYQDPEILQWLGSGRIKSRATPRTDIEAFEHCWQESLKKNIVFYNMNFGVWVKHQDESVFLGTVNLFTPTIPLYETVMNSEGRVEISGFGKFQIYGTQVFKIIVEDYIPYLQYNGFTVNGRPISYIQATSKPDNSVENGLLEKFFKAKPKLLPETQHDASRNFYERFIGLKEFKS